MRWPTDYTAENLREFWRTWRMSMLLFPLCVYFCTTWGNGTLLDAADLIIHEAGHFIFRFFGQFLHAAGGTLWQIILPSIIAWHFYRHGYRTGVQVGLLWLGQNLINISVYAADARARVLPLLGGNKVMHDWHYMLSRLNLLEYDTMIGLMFFGAAVITFIVMLAVPRAMW